ncbi:tyrosine-type recombinase/integrase [Clostridium sp. FP1]|uniref:tyrosine-type recombinase/integrase n=1 Tax=Clostridium sp. FP1 TaxID=2724076 RepID=UPI00192DB4C3|nr:tyrosine-type recombinase/integrase [Clostridium sp. FP1]MBZ9634370.1 tyrosine-type recombinase/integrase [Clostridium sp. FP1]
MITKEPNKTLMQMQIRTICSVFCSTGLRASEFTSLRISDVDLHESIIYTNHTKAGKHRIVPISSSLKPLQNVKFQIKLKVYYYSFKTYFYRALILIYFKGKKKALLFTAMP